MTDLREPPEDPIARTDATPSPPPYPPTAPPAGFDDFYRVETPLLVGFLMWQGARLADAADVAQDTMIDAYRQWASVREPRAWIRRVAARKWWRRHLAGPGQPAELVDGGPLVRADDDITAFEQQHDILRLLASLPPRQRQVMAWHYDDYTTAEIAAELGIDEATVRSHLRHARRAIAGALDRAEAHRPAPEGGHR